MKTAQKSSVVVVVALIVVALIVLMGVYIYYQNQPTQPVPTSQLPAGVSLNPTVPQNTPVSGNPLEESYIIATGTSYVLNFKYINTPESVSFVSGNTSEKVTGIQQDLTRSYAWLLHDQSNTYLDVEFCSVTTTNCSIDRSTLYQLVGDTATPVSSFNAVESNINRPPYFHPLRCNQSSIGQNIYCLAGDVVSVPGEIDFTLYALQGTQLTLLGTGKPVYDFDFPSGPSFVSGVQGQTYFTIGNGVYEIINNQISSVEGIDPSSYSIDLSSVGGNVYALAISNSNSWFYGINETTATDIGVMNGFDQANIFLSGGITYGIMTKTVPGFCGDAVCTRSSLFVLQGGNSAQLLNPNYQPTQSSVNTQNAAPASSLQLVSNSSNPTTIAGTTLYTDPPSRFSISYPSDFALADKLTEQQQKMTASYMEACPSTHAVAIMDGNGAGAIGLCYVGSQTSDGFTAAALVLTPDSSVNMQACQQPESSGYSPQGSQVTTTINGVTFYENKFDDAAAGHYLSIDSYRTYQGGTCYTIDLKLESDVGKSGQGLSTDFAATMQAKLKSILSTIQF